MEAILVAGGQGKRLGVAAQGLPKALVPVAGRPLASYMVERLHDAGVERVIANCARGSGELFQQKLSGCGCEIVAAEEPEPLGRGGGVRFAARLLLERERPFFVVYGDELIDVDFDSLEQHHRATAAELTITSAPLTTPFGVLDMDDYGRVSAFEEGPTLPDHWVNVGVYVMEPSLLAELPRKGDAEHELFPRLAAAGRLWAYRHTGIWLTVNTAKDLEAAERRFEKDPHWLRSSSRRRGRLAHDVHQALERVSHRRAPAQIAAAQDATAGPALP